MKPKTKEGKVRRESRSTTKQPTRGRWPSTAQGPSEHVFHAARPSNQNGPSSSSSSWLPTCVSKIPKTCWQESRAQRGAGDSAHEFLTIFQLAINKSIKFYVFRHPTTLAFLKCGNVEISNNTLSVATSSLVFADPPKSRTPGRHGTNVG